MKKGNGNERGRAMILRQIKILCAALALAMVFTASAWAANAPWDTAKTDWMDKSTGNTQYDPYVISTADDLAGLAKLCGEGNEFKFKYIVLAGDIDLGGRDWFPIGSFTSYTGNWYDAFNGTFDGRGYAITGLNFV